jgi:hypothetical protein
MCNICVFNCGESGTPKKHFKEIHRGGYIDYQKCFHGAAKTILADGWDDSVSTFSGKTEVTHVPVRWFFGDPGPSRAARTVKPPEVTVSKTGALYPRTEIENRNGESN